MDRMEGMEQGAILRESQIVMKPHARGKRVWLQGAWLVKAGFARGVPHVVQIDASARRMTITADPTGPRKVAGVDARPIIDVIGAAVTEAFPGESARVTVRFGQITIEGA